MAQYRIQAWLAGTARWIEEYMTTHQGCSTHGCLICGDRIMYMAQDLTGRLHISKAYNLMIASSRERASLTGVVGPECRLDCRLWPLHLLDIGRGYGS